jgi:hypothetical protein
LAFEIDMICIVFYGDIYLEGKKMKWSKETAERFVNAKIASGKTILIDGTLSLKQCSAADYLVNNHGYIYNTPKKRGENK